MQLSLLCALALVSVMAAPTLAQGTRADYERAAKLQERFSNKLFRASVKPEWSGDRFWYRNDLPGGRREFLLVDSTAPSRRPAFDHARLASSLSTLLHKPIEAERLPVERIAFTSNPDALRMQVGDTTYLCDLKTYALQPDPEPLGRAKPLAPETAPKASYRTGEEVRLTLLNQSKEEVALFWLDGEGLRHPYGTLKPGEQNVQRTYAGHVWLIVGHDGKPLVAFVAEKPGLAVIDGVHPEPEKPNEPDQALSPDGRWRVVLRDHNLLLHEVKTGQETPLTHDGAPDDSYEDAPTWSPDSTKFVIFKTVPAQEHKVYTVESSPTDQLQPKLHTIDYLKPGDRIAHPRPHLFDIAVHKEVSIHDDLHKEVSIHDDLFPNPFEISELHWNPDSSRFSFLYNQRGHQVMRLVEVDAATGAARTLIDEEAKTFIDWTNKVNLHRLDRTHEAIWMSERDGWNHLYLYDTATGQVKNQITKGEWVVRSVERVDEEKRQIWFRAGGIVPGQDPYYLHYCRVNFDGTGLTQLTEGDGTHDVTFSPDVRYLVDTYSRVDLPPITVLRRASDGGKLLELERGDDSALRAAGWRPPERFVAKGRDGKTDIYGLIFRPTNFDPNRRYPVVENIYAGPQAAYTPKGFAPFHGPDRIAELGFIVVQMDAMGTNFRSRAFHDVCWKNLADAGFPDRILWIKAAAAKYPAMDLTRIGIYGTSAGGQNALGGLLLHGDFYRVGVADCGCHDNRMDKIWWNEQWMGWPIGPEYAADSNVTLAPKLQGKLLLMVGELDTNVDPASTMQVVNALIKADKDFDLLVMPGAGHGVAGSAYGRRRLEDFLVRNLLGVEPRAQ